MSEDGAGSGSAGPGSAGPGSAGPGSAGSERQVPFFCPYCGEESLRPSGPEAGAWACGSCARGFKLSFAGLTGSGAER